MPTVTQDVGNDACCDEEKRGTDLKVAAADSTDVQPQDDVEIDPQLRRLELLKQQYGVSQIFFILMLRRQLLTSNSSAQSTWDGPDDPNDPYNWPSTRKVLTGIIFSMSQLITLMTASIISAALNDISSDLHIGMSSAQMIFSTYFLGIAFGPFVVAAISEMHGRKWIWVAGNTWYILWNAISPVGKSVNVMILSRLMAGFGACAGVTVRTRSFLSCFGHYN